MTTTNTISEIAVCNMAANTLDERRLNSFDDNTSFARFCADEFGFIRDEFLRMYPWAFATEFASLPALQAPPAFRYKYAYQVPDDSVRVLPLTLRGAFEGTPVKYQLASRKIYTDEPAPLPVIYIRRETNLALWDPLAARALGQYIALHAAHRTTGKNSYIEKAQNAYAAAMWEAKHVDSLERGTVESLLHGDDTSQIELLSVRSWSSY